jgi:hypothetical protein
MRERGSPLADFDGAMSRPWSNLEGRMPVLTGDAVRKSRIPRKAEILHATVESAILKNKQDGPAPAYATGATLLLAWSTSRNTFSWTTACSNTADSPLSEEHPKRLLPEIDHL